MRLYEMLTFTTMLNLLMSKIYTSNLFVKTRYHNMLGLEHFWQNTGFCPSGDSNTRAKFLLSKDERINLDIIGALPNNAITHIRIHWLLDLVKYEGGLNKPIFDFFSLDVLMDKLYQNNLSPIFELMGNPSNYFYDFKIQSEQWSGLIGEIQNRYRRFYGVHFVKNWRFELTNEPDLKIYNRYNFTLETYLDYFRASETAVENLAGPAGLFKQNKKVHSLCWGLLDYCNLTSCNLNMITFHRKGDGIGSKVVDGSLNLINFILLNYPNLKGVGFGNDEADIQTGWIKPFQWRADVRYAALIVQVIIGHIKKLLVDRSIPFKLLSNDNAFLSYSPNYFTQRTLLARFQMNNTTPRHVQFFKKPAYSIFALLSQIGNKIKDIQYRPGEEGITYLVSSLEQQDTFLMVLTNDNVTDEILKRNTMGFYTLKLKIKFRNSIHSGKYIAYSMNNLCCNPYKIWLDAERPDFPNVNVRKKMRESEGFTKLFNRRFKPHQTYVELVLKDVTIPYILFINLCFEGIPEAGPVIDLRYEKMFKNEILLLWKDTLVQNRCLLTYVVEFRNSTNETFYRINAGDTIFLSYHFDGRLSDGSFVGITGQYRVAALDYWSRKGLFSNILTVSEDI